MRAMILTLFFCLGLPLQSNAITVDAFIYQITADTPEAVQAAVTNLQQALCWHYQYQATVPDPDYPGEVVDAAYQAAHPGYDLGDIPLVPNPESCPDFANRKQTEWFNALPYRRDRPEIKAEIEAAATTIIAARKAGKGVGNIKRSQ